MAFVNAELRFPLLRRVSANTGIVLPPIDGLFFYDAGVAWSGGQSLQFSQRPGYDFNTQRSLLQSYGVGARINLFNFAIVRWDYAKAINRPNQPWFGTWFFGMSY